MSLYNDKGQRHGYWELFYVRKNYHHGILHGKYEYYYDKEKTKLFGELFQYCNRFLGKVVRTSC